MVTFTRTRRTRHDHCTGGGSAPGTGPGACRTGQDHGVDRGAALAVAFPRFHHRDQIWRPCDERPGAARGVRRGCRVPAVRGPSGGRGPRGRATDHCSPGPSRCRVSVRRWTAGNHPGDHGDRPDGPGRSGQPGCGGSGQQPRSVRGGSVRRGRQPAHRAAQAGRRGWQRGRHRPGRGRGRGRPGDSDRVVGLR